MNVFNNRFSLVLEKTVFDVSDAYNLLDNLDKRFTLSPDGIQSIFLKRLTAPFTLSLNIHSHESLIRYKALM